MLKLKVQGQVFMTWTQIHIFLLEELEIGTNLLLYLDPKLEPWKNILENTSRFLNMQSDFFGKLTSRFNLIIEF